MEALYKLLKQNTRNKLTLSRFESLVVKLEYESNHEKFTVVFQIDNGWIIH